GLSGGASWFTKSGWISSSVTSRFPFSNSSSSTRRAIRLFSSDISFTSCLQWELRQAEDRDQGQDGQRGGDHEHRLDRGDDVRAHVGAERMHAGGCVRTRAGREHRTEDRRAHRTAERPEEAGGGGGDAELAA